MIICSVAWCAPHHHVNLAERGAGDCGAVVEGGGLAVGHVLWQQAVAPDIQCTGGLVLCQVVGPGKHLHLGYLQVRVEAGPAPSATLVAEAQVAEQLTLTSRAQDAERGGGRGWRGSIAGADTRGGVQDWVHKGVCVAGGREGEGVYGVIQAAHQLQLPADNTCLAAAQAVGDHNAADVTQVLVSL